MLALANEKSVQCERTPPLDQGLRVAVLNKQRVPVRTQAGKRPDQRDDSVFEALCDIANRDSDT